MFESIDLDTSTLESILRLSLAVVLGAVFGWDRETEDRPAGLRTHMMVALGAAGFTLIAIEMVEAYRGADISGTGEALRIVAAIVGGVGFLGAGAIIQSGGRVQGLTTAASLWVVSAVGVSAGAGYYSNAVALSVLGLIVLTVLRRVEQNMRTSSKSQSEENRAEDRSTFGRSE